MAALAKEISPFGLKCLMQDVDFLLLESVRQRTQSIWTGSIP